MDIKKDSFYEKIEELKCNNCGASSPEYYFDSDLCPLCESCTFEILKDECNELREINDLDDETEEDVEVANELFNNQKQQNQ